MTRRVVPILMVALLALFLAFLAAAEVPVARMTKQGMRTFDARAAVVSITVQTPSALPAPTPSEVTPGGYAIIELVVRLASPTVRPANPPAR